MLSAPVSSKLELCSFSCTGIISASVMLFSRIGIGKARLRSGLLNLSALCLDTSALQDWDKDLRISSRILLRMQSPSPDTVVKREWKVFEYSGQDIAAATSKFLNSACPSLLADR